MAHRSISAADSRCGQSAVMSGTLTRTRATGAVAGDQRVQPIAPRCSQCEYGTGSTGAMGLARKANFLPRFRPREPGCRKGREKKLSKGAFVNVLDGVHRGHHHCARRSLVSTSLDGCAPPVSDQQQCGPSMGDRPEIQQTVRDANVTLIPAVPQATCAARKRPFDLSGSHLGADRALNHHGVGPFAESKGHRTQVTHLPKATGLVQPQ